MGNQPSLILHYNLDISGVLFGYLSGQDILNLMCTCKDFQNTILFTLFPPWKTIELIGGIKTCGLMYAAGHGYLDYYKMWRSIAGSRFRVGEMTSNLFTVACCSGNLDLVRYIYNNYPDIAICIYSKGFHGALSCSIQERHLHIVKFLLDETSIPITPLNIYRPFCNITIDIEMLRVLLSHKRVDPSIEDNAAIVRACIMCGGYSNVEDFEEAINLLLSNPRVVPKSECLLGAANAGSLSLFKRLLTYPNVNPADVMPQLLIEATGITSDHKSNINVRLEIIKIILADPRIDLKINPIHNPRIELGITDMILKKVIPNCESSIVNIIINDPRIFSANVNFNLIIDKFIIASNAIAILPLLENATIRSKLGNPRFYDFLIVCIRGSANNVRNYLSDETFDPTCYINMALRCLISIAKESLVDNVRVLLEDVRVLNCLDFRRNFNLACYCGYVECVLLMLGHPEFNIADMDNAAYTLACRNGRKGCTEIVKILLADRRISPASDFDAIPDENPLYVAVRAGKKKIVKRLLEDDRVDPSINNDEILKEAIEDDEILLILLKDRRTDPTFDNNFLIKHAFQHSMHDVLEHLLNDSRIDNRCIDLKAVDQTNSFHLDQRAIRMVIASREFNSVSSQQKRLKV